jgi:hypothetical protein
MPKRSRRFIDSFAPGDRRFAGAGFEATMESQGMERRLSFNRERAPITVAILFACLPQRMAKGGTGYVRAGEKSPEVPAFQYANLPGRARRPGGLQENFKDFSGCGAPRGKNML